MKKKSDKKKDHKKYIDHILKNLPGKPGVYKMKDKNDNVIYIGKAVNLKSRISSYFKSPKDKSVKTEKLVSQIADIDFIEVESDLEAVMLETNLIKEFQPKYNILMKDDKNFVYIKITVNEDFPRIYITRKVEKDKARYFGPKTAQHKVIKTLKVLKKIFPYRHCQLNIDWIGTEKVKVTKAGIKYPCIDYHIKRCAAPCIGKITPKKYREIIDQIIRFLEGNHKEILTKLKEDMMKAASDKKFETAAALRDKVQAIEDIMERQSITAPDHKNLDVLNYYTIEEKVFFNLFQVRSGKLINQENFELKAKLDRELHNKNEILTSFLKQYYEKATDIPKEVLIPHEIDTAKTIEKWLTEMKGQKVSLIIPKRGRKNKLLELSHKNAKNFARLSEVKWQGGEKSAREKALQELAKLLKLDHPPKRLECYDISHLGGTKTVSSMVVFENGFPKKDDYRKFKLHQNTPGSPNDYASMEETLTRRLKYLKPSILNKELRILKPTKKDLLEIAKQLKVKKLPKKEFLTIKKGKTYLGFTQLFTDPKKKILIEKIQLKTILDQAFQLRNLIKKIAEKAKTKRIYITLPKKDQSKYEEAGCQTIFKIPDTFKIQKSHIVLVLDLTKYKEDSSFKKKPSLLVIDGGKGQLSTVVKVLKKYKLEIPVISIAKKNEEIYTPGKTNPIILPKDSPTLHLIQHIRDEAHRFAVKFQSVRNLKATKHSTLDEIYGIGDSTKLKLLKHFGSTESIKQATLHELTQIVGKKNAMKIKEKLK